MCDTSAKTGGLTFICEIFPTFVAHMLHWLRKWHFCGHKYIRHMKKCCDLENFFLRVAGSLANLTVRCITHEEPLWLEPTLGVSVLHRLCTCVISIYDRSIILQTSTQVPMFTEKPTPTFVEMSEINPSLLYSSCKSPPLLLTHFQWRVHGRLRGCLRYL